MTFLDASGQPITVLDEFEDTIDEIVVEAQSTSDRWELIGDRHAIPPGTRSLRYRFYATRNSGSENNAYLDNAQLFVLSEAVAPDLGAYGNTAEDVDATTPHIALRFPDLYVDWERGRPHIIRWDSYGNSSDQPVRIDLYQDTPLGPQFLLNIADVADDDGMYAWTPENSGVEFGTYGLRVQVSLVDNPAVFDRSAETFTVPENTDTFFVNDGDTSNDEYTSGPGDNRNTGKIPSAPKPNPANVFRIYSLGAGETLYTDTGEYPLIEPLVLSGTVGVGDDEGFIWTGPTDDSRTATLRHAHPATVAPLIELDNADLVTLAALTLPGGQYGVLANNDSTNLRLNHITVANSLADGIRIQDSSSATDLASIIAINNGGHGIYVSGDINGVCDSEITGNRQAGLYLPAPGEVSIQRNTLHDNAADGLYVRAPSGLISDNDVYGNRIGINANGLSSTDPILITSNVVYNNTSVGIKPAGTALVSRNTVYGQLGYSAWGIYGDTGATALVENVVHSNYQGIGVGSWFAGEVTGNRVYNNSQAGIYVKGNVPRGIQRNVVYSNLRGIHIDGGNVPDIGNNLVYANTIEGIRIERAYSDLLVTNNTVYQTVGDAIRITNSSKNVRLRNNILCVPEEGYPISVAADSQLGFQSDYNLYLAGTGPVGLWQNIPRQTLQDWRHATYGDESSFSRDPLFVVSQRTQVNSDS